MATSIFVSAEQRLLYKTFVEGIRSDLGRNVILHIPGTPKQCHNCLWDPVNKKSTGMYQPKLPLPAGLVHIPFTGGVCPVCNGTGQYTTETTKQVLAGIRWLKADQKRYMIQGLEADNDFRIKCDIKYYNDFKKVRFVEIDGIPTEVTAILKKGLGELIQIVVFLKKSDWPAGKKTDVSRI